ncbi:M20/M25/M40 family metallo-hydrolase, partial [Staphylococcus carnosus]
GGTSMIEDQGEVFPSFTLPLEHPGYAMLEKAHEAVHKEPLVSGMTTTVTDGGWLADFGIPTILYGPGSLTEAHSVDEKVEKEELAQYSEVLYDFLKNWYKNPEK